MVLLMKVCMVVVEVIAFIVCTTFIITKVMRIITYVHAVKKFAIVQDVIL